MRSSVRLLSRLAIIGGGLLPAIVSIPASAEVSQCAPITVDGAQVACVTLSAVQDTQPNGDPTLELTMTIAIAGESPVVETQTATIPLSAVDSAVGHFCVANDARLMGWDRYSAENVGQEFGIGVTDAASPGNCDGELGFTLVNAPVITPPGVGPITSVQPINQPYHVPQVCVTTAPGVCIGPFDGALDPGVPVPAVTPPGVSTTATSICVGAPPGSNAGTSGAPLAFEHINSYDPEYGTEGWFDNARCVPL